MNLKSKLILLKKSNHKTITNPVYLLNPEPTTLCTNKNMQILTNSYFETSQKTSFNTIVQLLSTIYTLPFTVKHLKLFNAIRAIFTIGRETELL